MVQTARLGLRVSNLERSLALYRDLLGWKVALEGPGMALLEMPNGTGIILTDSPDLDLTPWKGERFEEKPRGRRSYLASTDLRAIQERLKGAGISALFLNAHEVSSTLLITDSDGYQVAYYEDFPLTDAEILAAYEGGAIKLQQSLEGLTESDLDLVRAPGKWSIRQTVAHLLDSEFGAQLRLKFSLSESGRTYNGNAYTGDTWAAGLAYGQRPAFAEAALIRMLREHAAGLCRLVPGALDRYVLVNDRKLVVRDSFRLSAGHLLDHLAQIWETRKVHNR